MTNTPAKFKVADLARAMKVAKAEGMTVRIEPDGSFVIVPIEAPKGRAVDYKGEIRM
jgi:hypothetical protein